MNCFAASLLVMLAGLLGGFAIGLAIRLVAFLGCWAASHRSPPRDRYVDPPPLNRPPPPLTQFDEF